jgi:hypothetical protein
LFDGSVLTGREGMAVLVEAAEMMDVRAAFEDVLDVDRRRSGF